MKLIPDLHSQEIQPAKILPGFFSVCHLSQKSSVPQLELHLLTQPYQTPLSRSGCFRILPDAFRGNASTCSISFGTLKLANCSETNDLISSAVSLREAAK